jgi:hypothetical protein
MNRLTDLKIRNLSTKTEQMLSDGFGLYLKVRPNSKTKPWIYRFTQNGKTQKMQIGSYPLIGLAEARALARELDSWSFWTPVETIPCCTQNLGVFGEV